MALSASAAPEGTAEEEPDEDEVEQQPPPAAARFIVPVDPSGLAGTRDGFGGGSSEPEEPQDMACTRRFSRDMVSSRSLRSSVRISLK